MHNKPLARARHRNIVSLCREKLGRDLTEKEIQFVTSRGGFVALEMIMDSVSELDGKKLEAYLNQE
jgi:microsomal dipeptidase-like Zn-dependent dipeptidase